MQLNIQRGRVARPQRVVIYAPEGLGKTTLAAHLPEPLFLDFEKGTHHLDVARIEPKSLKEVEQILGCFEKTDNGHKTIVIDTIDWLEELAIQELCQTHQKKGIEDFGYGKGYVFLAERMNDLLTKLNTAANHVDVVLLAHSHVKKLELPETQGAYDRYELKLSKQVGPLVKEWCDALLFTNWKTKIRERDDGGDKTTYKGLGGKERMLYASHTAAWDGKNRHGLKDEEAWVTPEDGAKIVMRCLGNISTAAQTSVVGQSPKASAAKAAEPPSKPVDLSPPTVTEDQIPGVPAGPHPLAVVVGEHEADVNAYLVSRNVITTGQTYRDVKPDYIAKVQKNPAGFLNQALKGKGVAA